MVLVENYAEHHRNWLKCFNDPQMSDVVFEARNGKTFHCEKFVLEVASPYFKKFFSSGKCGGSSSKFVSAAELNPGALEWILRACYTGDGDLNDDNVIDVMLAAKRYEMAWVEKACLKYLKKGTGDPVVTFAYSKDNEKWQVWTVPHSGWYHIAAMGAKAADLEVNAQGYKAKGGDGALIGGSFQFTAGDIVKILTGGMSRLWPGPHQKSIHTGGGGGTFVAIVKKDNLSLLLAAGGGGSPNRASYGGDATLSVDGSGPDPKCQGGKNGGNGGKMDNTSSGGLGWKAGPDALAKPTGNGTNQTGGFGGGGNVLGGGGGYSGGAVSYVSGAGGGGSYVAPIAINIWKRIGGFGHGKVLIWSGKDVPSGEASFFNEFGEVHHQIKLGNEFIDSWEMVT